MAMNRTLGMEAQKMQGYVQEQIERRERRGIVFSDEIKEAIFDYALLIGNEDSVRKLVRDLADAISESQEEKVEDLLYDARQEIQELPDPTVGKLELLDYGYTANNMVPLRKEAALEYHRTGSKIYCLGSDGSQGEYASREMIEAHDGLYGMENQEWMRRTVYDRDFDSEDMGMLQEAMAVIDREEALKLYDAGADIYLITSFSTPQFVTERMEIERGPEHYQLPMTEREHFRDLEWQMKKYPQLQSLKEAELLIGTKPVFGIYQIRDDSAGTAYAFRNMNFIESHDLQVRKEDYKLVYVGELQGNVSLEDIFERFNIHRPDVSYRITCNNGNQRTLINP